MSTASPIAAGKRSTPRFAQGLIHMGARVATVILSAQAALAAISCARLCTARPGQHARMHAGPWNNSSSHTGLLTSGDSGGPPLGPKRDDVARVDLLSHYCCVRRQEVRKGKCWREIVLSHAVHEQEWNGPRKGSPVLRGGCQQKQPSKAASHSRVSRAAR